MNRAFEDIYHKPVILTCPPLATNQNYDSSDFNVAASPSSDKKPVDPFDSSDSCTSILLGYVDNRSRKLVKDIKECKDETDGDKRKKLVTLLTRLDHLRKLLMEEIVRNSSLNLEPFYRSVLEVETEQKEILYDQDANKENGNRKKSKRRESATQSQNVDLEKRLRDLLMKEQDRIAKLRDDNTIGSNSSDTLKSVDRSEPVKILIEVKNAERNRKSNQPKKITVTQISGTEVQHKTSIGSSASTAYRSPPATFHTDFTKVLSKQSQAKAKTTTTQPVQATPLAQYITRLLGMSQQSVDQLGVSTGSSVSTPSSSVIDVTDNIGAIDRSHLNRVQAKIDDSLRLAKEVDESFKRKQKTEEISKVTTKVREPEAKLPIDRQAQPKPPAKLHPSNVNKSKAPHEPKKATQKQKQKTDPIARQEATIEPQIPENSKRIIADLTKKIEQVRQDKQKMMENTLSSAHSSQSSGKEFDLTEYKDFVAPSKSSLPKSQAHDEHIFSSQASDVQSPPGHFMDEEAKNLMNAKQIGISFSRDSGIGSSRPASRPVTSTDFRISPDIKHAEKSLPSLTSKPVVETRDLPPDEPASVPEDTNVKVAESGSNRKSTTKPPISLKRYERTCFQGVVY